MLKMTYFSF